MAKQNGNDESSMLGNAADAMGRAIGRITGIAGDTIASGANAIGLGSNPEPAAGSRGRKVKRSSARATRKRTRTTSRKTAKRAAGGMRRTARVRAAKKTARKSTAKRSTGRRSAARKTGGSRSARKAPRK